MIIWLNGPCGIGKSSVAKACIDLLSNQKIKYLDADQYFPNFVIKNGGRVDAHSNIGFCQYFREIIESYMNTCKVILVDMKAAHDVAKTELIDYFTETGIPFFHIILIANGGTLTRRIEQDDDSIRSPDDKKEHLKQIYDSQQYFKEHFKEAKQIDTTYRSINDIANIIVDSIK